MDVCHVTTAHPARDIRIFHKECASLAAAGHRVTLLVAGKGEDCEEKGVRVQYIMVHYKSRPGRMLRAPFALAAAVLKINPQVVHFHDPEFLIATRRLQQKGIRVVYDVHEDLPRQILSKFYIPAWLRRPLASVTERYENRVARRLDAIVTATPHIAQRFLPLNAHTTDVRNFPLQEEFTPVDPCQKPTPPHLCYTGGISQIRGAGEMIDAIGDLDVILDLAGPVDSCDYFQQLRRFPGWKKKIYHGMVDRAVVSRLMGQSAIGLNLMHPVPNYVDAIPTKLFEYMLAGIPVIISDFPSWKAIVDTHQCGLAVNPLDTAQIREAIKTLLADPAMAAQMGARGREAALKHYSWETEREKLLMVYRNFESQSVA
ncbi:MAG TPA: glycosyltransferase family 4 protein [Bacteroidales bacterium]|nr:glycosyltransferase family 4 protein [Bacteroidales bacterium]HRZ48442.1 glycosyltransferase family 4 protein [Bacteroidales bacterium]